MLWNGTSLRERKDSLGGVDPDLLTPLVTAVEAVCDSMILCVMGEASEEKKTLKPLDLTDFLKK